MRKKTTLAIAAALAVGTGVALPAAAHANGGGDGNGKKARACAKAFDEAQSADMNSFKNKDLATQIAGHDANASSVITGGGTTVGRDAIIADTKKLFDTTQFTWNWTEKARSVNGCTSAYILYDTVFAIPSINLSIHAVTGVTYTHEDGRWVVILDQNTAIK